MRHNADQILKVALDTAKAETVQALAEKQALQQRIAQLEKSMEDKEDREELSSAVSSRETGVRAGKLYG